jgi:hypothetical protein
VSSRNSARPGDVLVAWGTGLGAANSDSNIASNGDLGVNLLVWVGGVQATVQYRGRSGGPGLDQVNFTVPAGVQPGCAVSLVTQTGGPNSSLLSNTVTIPVMPNGGQCSDPVVTGFPAAMIDSLLSKPSLQVTAVDMSMENRLGATGTPAFEGQINAFFLRLSGEQLGKQLNGSVESSDPSIGSCTVAIRVGAPSGGEEGGPPDAAGLDAGATITLAPPSGNPLSLAGVPGIKGVYSVSPAAPWSGGVWKESNGTGGADVPPFSIDLNIPQPLIWSNQTASVDRSQAFNLTWTGGDPAGYVRVIGSGGFGTNPNNAGTATFRCAAPVSAGQMTIPATVMRNLPSNTNPGYLQISSYGKGVFSLPGFDAGLLFYEKHTQYAPIWK